MNKHNSELINKYEIKYFSHLSQVMYTLNLTANLLIDLIHSTSCDRGLSK